MKKRLLSLLLALVMVLSVFPMTVFADDGDETGPVEEIEETATMEEETEPVEELPAEEEPEEEPAEETEPEEEPAEELPAEETEPEEEYTETAEAMNAGEDDGIKTAGEFDTALAAGGEIVLADNIEVTKTPSGTTVYTISKNTTIDLNGKTLTINVSTTRASTLFFDIKAGGSLTVKDSTSGAAGKFILINTGAQTGYIVKTTENASGAFTLESGNIEIKKTGSKALNGIWTAKGAGAIISGGSIKYEGGGTLSPLYDGGAGITVSGGEFNFEPNFAVMAPGKVSYQIAEGEHAGWYGVTDGTYVGAVDNVAYTSLTDFAKAIDGNTGKITVDESAKKLTLTGDVALADNSTPSYRVIFMDNATLDLAGHKLSAAFVGSTSKYLLYVNQTGITVTITDSSTGKTGSIENNPAGYSYVIGVNKGTLFVDGAEIVGKSTKSSVYVLRGLSEDATIRLNQAKITAIGNGVKGTYYDATGVELVGGSCLKMDDSVISVTGHGKCNGIFAGLSSGTTSAQVEIGQSSDNVSKINLSSDASFGSGDVAGISSNGLGAADSSFKIKNCDITVEATSTNSNSLKRYGISMIGSKATLDVQDNVNISVKGSKSDSEAYGIYSETSQCDITGKDVEITLNCPQVTTCYGFYTKGTNSRQITIDPADDGDVTVSVTGKDGGNTYISGKYSTATNKTIIKGGTFTGGGFMDGSASITGGVFDRDPGENAIDAGYIAKANTPTEGKWRVAIDDTPRVKNVTQDKTYVNLAAANEEAHDHDELQLLEDVNANSDMTITSVDLDLNGHNVTLSKLYTVGDVTITDKQATSYEDAGTLNARIIVGAGETTLTGINHEYTTNSFSGYPFETGSANDATPAMLTIKGVKGVYGSIENSTQSKYVVFAKANSRVVIDNAAGFETDLSLNTVEQSPELVYGDSNNCSTIIRDGVFTIVCNNDTSGNCFVFNADATALISGGKFNLKSNYNFKSKIVSNVSSTVNVQGGYYVATYMNEEQEAEVSQTDFFGNASTLGSSNGKTAVTLETTDPMYEAGYRYTVKAVPVATANSGQEYYSLEAAIKAAANTGTTVNLLVDVVLTEYTLDKNVTFEANGHTVKLNGNNPLTLAAGIEKPECFDVSDALGYIEKKTGEKVYYKYWGGGSSTGVITDYDSNTCEQFVLTKDMNRSSTLMVNKTCTIDLNGYSIIGNNCQYETFDVYGTNSVVTVKDSSEAKNGKITGNNDKYYTVLIDGNGCSFILESGIVENTTTNGAAISTLGQHSSCDDVTITINGGKVIANKGFAIVDNGSYSKNITINVNGGEITSTTGVAIYHPASGVMTLSGGTITGGTGIYMRSGKLVVPENSTVQVFAKGAKGDHDDTISGAAVLTGDAVDICVSGYPGGAPTADVKGGRFASDNAKAIGSYATTGKTPIKGFLSGGYYSSRPESALIKEGYTAISYKDDSYPKLHWEIGDIPEINVGEATVDEESKAITIGGKTITVTNGEGQSVATQEAANAITGMLDNDAVADFSGTNIDNATNKEKVTDGSYDITKVMAALKTAAPSTTGVTAAVITGDDQITVTTSAGDDVFTETDIKKQVTVDLTSSKVESVAQPEASAVTTVTSATFDVKPVATITTVDENGDAVVIKTQIPNGAITSPITFRLPVDAHMTVDSTMVYHSDTLDNPKKDCLGVFPIQEENGKKFIELSASSFSFYTYEDLSVNANSVAVIIDNAGDYTGYDALADAITAFNGSGEGAVENAVSIILLKDVNGSTDFGSKVMTLDLNGCKLIGSVENAANVTVTNTGDTQKTLAATGVYKNDVSTFVMDGFDTIDYDTATEGIDYRKVINNTAADIFSVVVVPVPGSYSDRDSVTEGIDLYAGDTVKMDVRVYGAKFVGADVTLYYDKTNFKMTDAPVSGWDGDVKIYENDNPTFQGKTRFYAAKSTQGGASEYYNLNKIDNDGNMYYSLGTFEFEALPGANEALKVAFQVEPIATGEIGQTTVAPVYVAGAWSQGWNSTPANQLTQDHLVNALVNVRLKSMSAVVNGVTGLVYNASERNLVKSGAGAKDSISQQAISDPTITYAVVTKAEADAEDFNASTLTYTANIPQQTDAGDYVVFYRVSKDGYITVADKLNVSIAKKDVDLNWTFGSGEAYKIGDNTATEIVSDFYIAYTEGNTEGYTAPVAKYDNAGGGEALTAEVKLTSFNDAAPAEDTKLIKVGKYVYTATVDPNYNIKSGESKVVEVTGAHIEGYTLTAKNNTEAEPTIGNVWYDGAAHTPAQLNTAENATAGVTIKYHTLKPGATQWTESDTIPEFTAAGTYQVKAVLTKDSYYDLTLDTVTFTIKSATYVTEKFDWVTGWDVVLVYTNDIVPGFTYDGAKMYDVSELGYKYGTTKNADGTVGTQAYTHVFGLVIAGDADITKVKSSNETALNINYSTKSGNTTSGVAWARLDVNSSSSVELLDLVFVQGVYNVNETYMAQQMANVLKSDVNGDKMVDTRDCALIKANS